ncbi:GPCR fungal pheromone mating factor [Mycena capillaripes]|nr:GPCR fungal pheromone mating factor [Mycena capillaripes]
MPGALAATPFIASALVLVTFPHHWRVKNFATLSIIAWLCAYNFIYGIDAIIWDGNTDIVAPIWCDIVTKAMIGADTSIPCCCLCLARQLYHIACGMVPPQGWKERTVEITLCWGFPTLIMALHYVVQGHRFDLLENLGCWPAVYYSWPSVIILTLSRWIPAVVALLYSTIAFFHICRKRLAFRSIMEKSECSLTLPQYIRLMIMVVFLGTYNVALISVCAVDDYSDGLQPWISWSYVHEGFSYVGQYGYGDPSLGARDWLYVFVFWSAIPLTGLLFFALFGIGEEARNDYVAGWKWATALFCRTSPPVLPTHGWEMATLQLNYILPALERIPSLSWDVQYP